MHDVWNHEWSWKTYSENLLLKIDHVEWALNLYPKVDHVFDKY